VIIARSPLRISLGGGGTDLPSYYSQFGGVLIAAAIDKYVYVTVNRPFSNGISLKYSTIENVSKIEEISHPIIKEALKILNLDNPQIEISSIADIPAGTGLGSSGSFTTALLKAIHSFYRKTIHSNELAELACAIELEKLREPVGKQDQYIAAYGGISEFVFDKDGTVKVVPLALSMNAIHDLEDNLLLFFTGISRSASDILIDQNLRSIQSEKSIIENLHFTKELGINSKDALLLGDTKKFGQIMNEHWEHKRVRSPGISNNFIDDAYKIAMQNGALGGKLVGAGGGGFLMFYASDREKLRNEMLKIGLREVRFRFDFEGTKVIFS
jgi:D-glycero-alpha-D-manno-heptose-7-phosphate kinase